MKAFIANFGQENYLWPKCRELGTVATINNEILQPFWEKGDRQGYIAHALAHQKTARGELPTRSVASRWFSLMEAISETSGDLWVHRAKDELWWTTTRRDPVQIELAASFNPSRDGPQIYEFHKPAEAWSDRNRKGGRLSWHGLHPKAKDFLFTEGTLQQLQPDNAAYALALIAGEDLSAWHDRPEWRKKVERSSSKAGAVKTFDPLERAAWIMADQALSTASQSNGQQVLRTVKEKNCDLSKEELQIYIVSLLEDQERLCAITGIPFQFQPDVDDKEMLCSLDRLDSSGHYERGNLQIVCRFVNRWKSDTVDTEFRRLVGHVRALGPLPNDEWEPHA
ncbi:MAG: hypothetical protein PSV22_12140 [Pseudolabrys sp.]|nr:hypothetical protein [Pseudolabrys sp.]